MNNKYNTDIVNIRNEMKMKMKDRITDQNELDNRHKKLKIDIDNANVRFNIMRRDFNN